MRPWLNKRSVTDRSRDLQPEFYPCNVSIRTLLTQQNEKISVSCASTQGTSVVSKTPELKDNKTEAKEADRHAIAAPSVDRAKWARSLTTQRVSDLFKTLPGLDGHWTQLQGEVNRGNNNFVVNSKTDDEGKKLIKFIGDAVVAAAKAAKFDFPQHDLKFTNDMGWLKISRANGQVIIKSRP